MDLFSQPRKPERLGLPDAEVIYFENVFTLNEADRYLAQLLTTLQWREEQVLVWGKRYLQPRLVAWHGDPEAVYHYSGSTLQPAPWTALLLSLKEQVEALAKTSFNSVLLNLYRNERDHMGWHSDNEPELGSQPVIASVSLGETREFQLRHKQRKDLSIARLRLSHGSVLIMSGLTQTFWQHRVKQETSKLNPRINLTFRQIKPHV